MPEPYEIRYAQTAATDIRGLRKSGQVKVLDGIEQHLRHQPKLGEQKSYQSNVAGFWSQYRLRIDDLRVHYDVDDSSNQVHVLRVLSKTRQTTPEESP